MKHQIKFFIALVISVLVSTAAIIGCGSGTPSATPLPGGSPAASTATATAPLQVILPTYTPVSMNDPLLAPFKKQLTEALVSQDRDALQQTASFIKWVGAIYREGGTPPIDPPRGLALTLNFLQENNLIIDGARTTYEPTWNKPIGDTSILGLITPKEGDPYYAHFYVEREPSAWRYVGIMTRIPYYDAPTVAQLRATPTAYDGKEFMYVGEYQPVADAPAGAGPAPESASYVLNTFAGPIWVVQKTGDGLYGLPADVEAHAGELARVMGTVKLNNGVPYIESDSFQFVAPDSWAHTQGVVESIDAKTLHVTIKPGDNGASALQLTPTSFVSLPDGKRGSFEDIKVGQTIDATGVPQTNGSLQVEALYISK
jgi:hypothetical protein